MLRIAIQAKGRLNEDTIKILADAGITTTDSKRKLISHAHGFEMDVLFLRDDDIPQAVAMGVADIGIVGINEVEETGQKVDVILPLGFGECRLSLAVPRGADYGTLAWFDGKRIATSYPNILRKYIEREGLDVEIHQIAGSVEVAPAVGMADAIFDIVSSGGTLVQNGLVEVETVLHSEAVLIANPNLTADKLTALNKLTFRFKSIIASRGCKYVLMNLPESALDRAIALMPGMKSPTILRLAEPGWCSIHAVIRVDVLWDTIERLKEIGAEDILILSLENIVK